MSDELIGAHLRVTQKTFDLEQFCQRRAEKLCSENRLKFTHCEDYDIKIQHVRNAASRASTETLIFPPLPADLPAEW